MKAKVTDALWVAEQDDGASTVLVAVVRELAAKADKAGRGPGRDAVIELEQAGDSAKAAAEADSGAGARTKVSGAFGSLAGSEDRGLASGPVVCNRPPRAQQPRLRTSAGLPDTASSNSMKISAWLMWFLTCSPSASPAGTRKTRRWHSPVPSLREPVAGCLAAPHDGAAESEVGWCEYVGSRKSSAGFADYAGEKPQLVAWHERPDAVLAVVAFRVAVFASAARESRREV